MGSSQFNPVDILSSLTSSSDEEEIDIATWHRSRVQEVASLVPMMMHQPIQTRERTRRRYIYREREKAHQQLWNDYFAENCTYPHEIFRRRFRMRRELFMRILKDVESFDEYFTQRRDALNRLGCSSLQKVTAAIRVLAYGYSADCVDEYVKIGETTTYESLKKFCDDVIALYEAQYLRSPNESDIARLLHQGEERGFPGMLGSLDCMHWEWKNFPTAYHGAHRGHYRKPTLILEAVATKDLWIWHAFFGMAGSHNDLNVLDHSPLFDNFIYGRTPEVNYVVNGHQYRSGYYLTDGIYPQWSTLIQTVAHPITLKDKLFAKKQEATRKDVERAFGVLQSRWGITRGPARFWEKNDLCKIMKACIILHNMIVEDEQHMNIEDWSSDSDEMQNQYYRNPDVLGAYIFSRRKVIQNREINMSLKSDLKEHLWNHCANEVFDLN